MKRALFTLLLLATGQASAGYCHATQPSETFKLDKIVSITQTYANSSKTVKTVNTYASGLLRSEVEETKSPYLDKMNGKRTYTYTPARKIETFSSTITVGSDTAFTREVYKYDTQGRLTRVLAQASLQEPLKLVATCTYGPSTITELTTMFYGTRPKTLEYTLDAAGNVTQLNINTEGNEGDTDLTTFTYRNGKLLRAEHRETSDLFTLNVTVSDYNAAGLLIREDETNYDKNKKLKNHVAYTYKYDMDSLGNWTKRRTYTQYTSTAELTDTTTRVIVYRKP